DADEFRQALPLFKDTPLIFAKVHPQHVGQMPLEDALKEVDGRLVGTPQDVLVNSNGTLFRGKLSITDPEVNELVKDGRALLSTAFSAAPDENGVLRNIVPNHILVYPAEPGAPNPGDQAALFLNQKQNETEKNGDQMAEEVKNDKQLDLMRELVSNQAAKDELQTKVTEQTETILNQKSDLEAKDRTISEKDGVIAQKDELITNQKTEIETLNAKVTELSGIIEESKTNAKKARRDKIFNQFLPGTKTAFEARKEEIYDDSKFEDLFSEMFQHQANVKEPPTEESGTEEINNQGNDKKEEADAQYAWDLGEVRL
ncbi:MAG: hypothetical protein PHN69_08075, partial [Candidatus Pacebacteria bacterium]|nr:hypothetical protein [Candidatus Paceibacterota bacterium]